MTRDQMIAEEVRAARTRCHFRDGNAGGLLPIEYYQKRAQAEIEFREIRSVQDTGAAFWKKQQKLDEARIVALHRR